MKNRLSQYRRYSILFLLLFAVYTTALTSTIVSLPTKVEKVKKDVEKQKKSDDNKQETVAPAFQTFTVSSFSLPQPSLFVQYDIDSFSILEVGFRPLKLLDDYENTYFSTLFTATIQVNAP